MLAAVHPAFPAERFISDALHGFEALELLPRGWHIAHALRRHLPQDYAKATEILINSLGPKLTSTDEFGYAPFVYLPHVYFVAEYGLEHFALSMQAQYELTQRFTAEFSIRPYLEKHPQQTLKQLHAWASDPSPHVRRLVSEGTRPRLPWASRLKEFQRDPTPVLELLELLKDDPVLYVRRSVANNLNDIGKDHPQLLFATTRRWMHNANDERRWLVKHALRSTIKAGNAEALDILGFSPAETSFCIGNTSVTPAQVKLGEQVDIRFDITNIGKTTQRLLADFRVWFVKANGTASPKVFKLKAMELAPGQNINLSKTLSLAAMTTRRHYSGMHRIEAILNGKAFPLGEFQLFAE